MIKELKSLVAQKSIWVGVVASVSGGVVSVTTTAGTVNCSSAISVNTGDRVEITNGYISRIIPGSSTVTIII